MLFKGQEIEFFKEDEFPKYELDRASVGIIKALDAIRKFAGHSIYPSPVSGALSRIEGSLTSRHYAVGRDSDAIDFITQKDANLLRLLTILQGCKLFGGIGVYFDTRGLEQSHDVMFHVDLRPVEVGSSLSALWYRNRSGYHYPFKQPMKFAQLYSNLIGLS